MMNRNKIIYTTLFYLCFAAVAIAQDAASIMDNASAAFKKHKSVVSNYTLTYTEGGKNRTSTGGIVIQGNKYVNKIGGTMIWFNGKTMWTLVEENEEVNVSEPDKDELSTNNPYYFIQTYKQDFNPSLVSNANNIYTVKLTPKKHNEDLQYVILTLAKGNYQPKSIQLVMAKSRMSIVLNTFKKKKKYKSSSFNFNSKSYPGYEVVDLR